jgi:hypothetical protein
MVHEMYPSALRPRRIQTKDKETSKGWHWYAQGYMSWNTNMATLGNNVAAQ